MDLLIVDGFEEYREIDDMLMGNWTYISDISNIELDKTEVRSGDKSLKLKYNQELRRVLPSSYNTLYYFTSLYLNELPSRNNTLGCQTFYESLGNIIFTISIEDTGKITVYNSEDNSSVTTDRNVIGNAVWTIIETRMVQNGNSSIHINGKEVLTFGGNRRDITSIGIKHGVWAGANEAYVLYDDLIIRGDIANQDPVFLDTGTIPYAIRPNKNGSSRWTPNYSGIEGKGYLKLQGGLDKEFYVTPSSNDQFEIDAGTRFTITTWFKITEDINDDTNGVIMANWNEDGDKNWAITLRGDNYIRKGISFIIRDVANNRNKYVSYPDFLKEFEKNRWYNVLVSRYNGYIMLFIDGAMKGYINFDSGIRSNDQTISIGYTRQNAGGIVQNFIPGICFDATGYSNEYSSSHTTDFYIDNFIPPVSFTSLYIDYNETLDREKSSNRNRITSTGQTISNSNNTDNYEAISDGDKSSYIENLGQKSSSLLRINDEVINDWGDITINNPNVPNSSQTYTFTDGVLQRPNQVKIDPTDKGQTLINLISAINNSFNNGTRYHRNTPKNINVFAALATNAPARLSTESHLTALKAGKDGGKITITVRGNAFQGYPGTKTLSYGIDQNPTETFELGDLPPEITNVEGIYISGMASKGKGAFTSISLGFEAPEGKQMGDAHSVSDDISYFSQTFSKKTSGTKYTVDDINSGKLVIQQVDSSD